MPKLLVDRGVLDGSVAALPLSWLKDFECIPFFPRDLAAHVAELAVADALIVRTLTRVSRAIVAQAPRLRAVATLSSGVDHIDEFALQDLDIALLTGRGGNARPVADWVQWALARLHPAPLSRKRALVVGVGAVGTQVAQRLNRLQMQVVLCDPPRQVLQTDFVSIDLDLALRQPWDLVTLHVPLTQQGPHATENLLNQQRLQLLRGAIVLNAARGGVLDEQAALELRQQDHLRSLAVDTFVAEPKPDAAFVLGCDLATPHIGGHSVEGKFRVARIAVATLCDRLGLPPPGTLADAVENFCELAQQNQPLAGFEGLDRVAAQMREVALRGDSFETIRHEHRRFELAESQNLP